MYQVLAYPFFGRQGNIFFADAVENQRSLAFRFCAGVDGGKMKCGQHGYLSKQGDKIVNSSIVQLPDVKIFVLCINNIIKFQYIFIEFRYFFCFIRKICCIFATRKIIKIFAYG